MALLRRLSRSLPFRINRAAPVPAPVEPPSEGSVALPPRNGFTAHNIRLDNGEETYPEAGYIMSENGIFLAVQRLLRVIYPEGLQGRSIVDIGCLEGGFATEFARLGMISTGIEVRDSNFQNCLKVKAGTNLPNLNFIRDDATNIANYGPFDAVFVCGLLYHLDRPKQFLADVARVCRRVVILETHIARTELTPSVATYHLSEVMENEGLPGRWYPEYDVPTPDQLERLKWASWSNDRSFWIQKEYLLQLLKDLGFDLVLEQFDCDNDIATQWTTGWRKAHDRVLLVGIKAAGPV
jgi:2-polyprenyl-3-methyl-5-hydroxy-6-metoxy-1,4-benzoquinol methylase